MSSTYFFDKERFKPIITSFLNSNCDFNAMPIIHLKPMRIFIYENIPNLWVSDGYHFFEALFTKDAINDFRKFSSNAKFSSLRD